MIPLSAADRAALLSLARRGAEAGAAGTPLPRQHFDGALSTPCGAFVTLKQRADDLLRGCIGRVETREPLGATVVDVAAAATQDRRFDPVRPSEMAAIRIEISVLAPPHAIAPSAVEVGHHGLIVRHPAGSGLLLPQVAVEQGWDRETFLAQTCRKAGLAPELWKDAKTVVLAFSAEVFTEP